jgi:hypothetical protein
MQSFFLFANLAEVQLVAGLQNKTKVIKTSEFDTAVREV